MTGVNFYMQKMTGILTPALMPTSSSVHMHGSSWLVLALLLPPQSAVRRL